MIHLDFIVAGAQKAGTTSLHDWLQQLPGICLPHIKETHYFSHDERFSLGQQWYSDQFKCPNGDNGLIGEIDPEYLFFPIAAERLAMLTDVRKVLIVLRYPFDRAYSHYQMSVRRGYDELDFIEALKREPERLAKGGQFSLDHHSYVSRGLYAKQIRAFSGTLPRAEYKYVLFEDLISADRRAEVFEDICRFIGVNASAVLVDRSRASNQASMPRFAFLRDQIYRGGWLKRIAGAIVPDKWKLPLAMRLDQLNQKAPREKGTYDQSLIPDEVVHCIKSDVYELSQLTSLNFNIWFKRLDILRLASTGKGVP